MKKEEAGEDSSIRTFIGRVYKASYKLSEFVAQLLWVRNESVSIVVYEKGIVKAIAI